MLFVCSLHHPEHTWTNAAWAQCQQQQLAPTRILRSVSPSVKGGILAQLRGGGKDNGGGGDNGKKMSNYPQREIQGRRELHHHKAWKHCQSTGQACAKATQNHDMPSDMETLGMLS